MVEEEVHPAVDTLAGSGRHFVAKRKGRRDIGLLQRWVFPEDRGIGIAGVVELLDHPNWDAGATEDHGMVRDVAVAFQCADLLGRMDAEFRRFLPHISDHVHNGRYRVLPVDDATHLAGFRFFELDATVEDIQANVGPGVGAIPG
jgi:hypothetical protein